MTEDASDDPIRYSDWFVASLISVIIMSFPLPMGRMIAGGKDGGIMSEPATIGMAMDDDRIRFITLTHGGSPEHAGRTLLDHYDRDATARLLDLGDLSLLGRRPEDPGFLWDLQHMAVEDMRDDTLFDAWRLLTDEYCQSYRSRGELESDAKYCDSREALVRMAEGPVYLWEDSLNGWSIRVGLKRWKSLDDVLRR